MAYVGDYLHLVGFDNIPISLYPVAVFDNNEKLLGYANNPAQVASLWNGSAVNQALGNISVTSDSFTFLFKSPSNKQVLRIRATSFYEINSNITLIGTSYFSSYHQTVPYLYDKIKDYWFKSLTGYTGQIDNNGKVSHDRLKKIHQLIDGINYGETLFFYWCINDLLYQDTSSATNPIEKAVFKVSSSHYTALANCFSKSFNCFVDESAKINTTNFADTGNTFASKCGFLSKNILVLPDNTASVEFVSEGKTNIVYFVSDGIGQTLGTFDIYVNDLLYKSIECNDKTIDLTGQNQSIITEGDSYCSPNSIVLNLPTGPHLIRIENTSSEPVWLDYYSELETDIRKGAKPVYAANVPSFQDGEEILQGSPPNNDSWTAFNSTMESCNAALQEVYDFFRYDLGAPVALADVYTGFDHTTMYHPDRLHWSQAGSDHVLAAFNNAIKTLYYSLILV